MDLPEQLYFLAGPSGHRIKVGPWVRGICASVCRPNTSCVTLTAFGTAIQTMPQKGGKGKSRHPQPMPKGSRPAPQKQASSLCFTMLESVSLPLLSADRWCCALRLCSPLAGSETAHSKQCSHRREPPFTPRLSLNTSGSPTHCLLKLADASRALPSVISLLHALTHL